jgi:hypothetical protein
LGSCDLFKLDHSGGYKESEAGSQGGRWSGAGEKWLEWSCVPVLIAHANESCVFLLKAFGRLKITFFEISQFKVDSASLENVKHP